MQKDNKHLNGERRDAGLKKGAVNSPHSSASAAETAAAVNESSYFDGAAAENQAAGCVREEENELTAENIQAAEPSILGGAAADGGERTLKTDSERKARRKYSAWQKFNLVRNVLALAFYCFYCIYFIYHRQGNQVVNYILMGSTAVYFLLFIVTGLVLGRKGKRFTGASKRVYKMTRRFTLLINTILTGGAIINMSSFEAGLMIRVCAFIMIGNLVLNVLWLIFSPKIAKKYSEQISNIKTNAKSLWGGLKSLFKKGFAKEAEISGKPKTTGAAKDGAGSPDTNDGGEEIDLMRTVKTDADNAAAGGVNQNAAGGVNEQ